MEAMRQTAPMGGRMYNRTRPGWQNDGILVHAPRTWEPAPCWCTAMTDTASPAGGTFGRVAGLRCRWRRFRAVTGTCSSLRVSCSSGPVSTRRPESTQSPRTPRTLRCRTRLQGERGSLGRRSILRFASSRGGLSTCTASPDSARSGGRSSSPPLRLRERFFSLAALLYLARTVILGERGSAGVPAGTTTGTRCRLLLSVAGRTNPRATIAVR